MLDNINIENILFLDIETVPQYPNYTDLPEQLRLFWDNKSLYLIKKDTETAERIYRRAGIYSEFGKIICISVGFLNNDIFRVKSFYRKDEKQLLLEFTALLTAHYNKTKHWLCAHNGKEFDFPFLARRILINGLRLPKILDTSCKKPWEVQHLDTMELWKFGDYKNYTSLSLLAAIFGIPTPKDDIDGSKVYEVYYQENDLQRIVTYCQKDVLTVAQLLLRYKGLPLIPVEAVIISDNQ